MGDGEKTKFWTDNWIGEELCLSEIFPRLFSLEVNKEAFVSDRVVKRHGVSEFNWVWRRERFEWESDLIVELEGYCSRVNVGTGEDCWKWVGEKMERYATREGYF